MPGLGRQPGRDRRAAAAAGAARRRGRRRPRRPRPAAAVELDLPAEPGGPVRGRAGRARPGRTCAACCSASTSTRTTSSRLLAGYLAARAEARRRGRSPASWTCCTVFADLSELSRNRPGGERGRARQPGAQPARVLPQLPAEPRRRAGRRCRRRFQARLARVLGHYGVTEPGPHAGAGGGGVPDLPGPAADVGRRRGRRRRCCGSGWPSRRRPRRCASGPAWRWSTSSRPPRCASRRCPTWPAAWCSAGSPSRCCAATGPGLRRGPQPPALPGRAPGRAGPRRADRRPWSPAPSRWSGCSASGSAGPAADHAPLLEVLTRRYYGNRGLPGSRTREVAGCRFVTAEYDRRRRARPALRRHGRRLRRAAGDALARVGRAGRRRRRTRPRRRPLPRPGRTSRTPTRWPRALRRAASAAHPLPAAGPPGHHHRRRQQRRGDAPPLHVPPATARASPRTG